jgi:hypothetical protein
MGMRIAVSASFHWEFPMCEANSGDQTRRDLTRWGMRVSVASLIGYVVLMPLLAMLGLGLMRDEAGEFIGGLLGILLHAIAGWGLIGSLVAFRNGGWDARLYVTAPLFFQISFALVPFTPLLSKFATAVLPYLAM